MLHKGYEAWITCEGENLPEHGATLEGNDGKSFACFIPSENGKSFAINVKNGSTQDCIKLSFKVDGKQLAHSMMCRPGESWSKSGVRTSLDVEQPFQFANLQTTDDDELLNRLSNQADVGSIEVGVTRVYSEGRPAAVTVETFSGMGAVHERSKKAGAHSVGLGSGSLVQPWTQMWFHDPINPSEGKAVTFVFRYRPRDLLQAQGIIPLDRPKSVEAEPSTVKKEKKRPGSPQQRDAKRRRVESGSASGSGSSSQSAKRDLGVVEVLSDDDEDYNALKSRYRKLQDKFDRATRKKFGGVKQEQGIVVGSDGDVIDLTLDD
ncbi:hypothetical protein LXA43DRAFT_1047381 [Ganoderma leucocontextum]|nr:hypothetical protein LXA43DRAFT_1047381 [Ganoderma leucocontextum]